MAATPQNDALIFFRGCLLLRENCTAILEDEFTQDYTQVHLRSYGIRDVIAYRRFLEAYPNLFIVNEHQGEAFVSLTTNLNVCPAHWRKSGSCTEKLCPSLHICVRHLLTGKCQFGSRCLFGHLLETQENNRKLKDNYLDGLNIDELRLIFTLPFVRRGVTRPQVCRNFSSDGNCTAENCHFLHICSYYVKNECRHGKRCRINHDINDQVKSVLELYGVNVRRTPREILEDLLMYMGKDDRYDQSRNHCEWLKSYLSNARAKSGRITQSGNICQLFLQGRCKFGKDCRNIHDRP